MKLKLPLKNKTAGKKSDVYGMTYKTIDITPSNVMEVCKLLPALTLSNLISKEINAIALDIAQDNIDKITGKLNFKQQEEDLLTYLAQGARCQTRYSVQEAKEEAEAVLLKAAKSGHKIPKDCIETIEHCNSLLKAMEIRYAKAAEKRKQKFLAK